MDKKLQRKILEYVRQSKEVPRDQIMIVLSNQNIEKRSTIQENINLLLDNKLIHIVGVADTIALTNKGYIALKSWYERINWKKYAIKIFFLACVSLSGLFSEEIKIFIVSLYKKFLNKFLIY